MGKAYIMFWMAISTFMNLPAQSVPDTTLDKDFAAQVKSIDEFIQRFNGEETHPEIGDGNRMLNLIALFDYKMDHEGLPDSVFKKKITDFVKHIEEKGARIRLTDDDFLAEADITATIAGKPASIALILQSQSYNEDRVRWAIIGVRGLTEAGVIDAGHFYGISPVEHETHFMSIGDIFEYNAPEIWGYRGKDTKIDELSAFLAMARTGNVRIKHVNRLTMHCLEVPDYIFTVNEEGRNGRNSGWLISSFMKTDENGKKNYKSKLSGI